MKNDLKMPARYALVDKQEMSDITGGATLGGALTDLVTGVVSGCTLVVTTLATAVISIVDIFANFINSSVKGLGKK